MGIVRKFIEFVRNKIITRPGVRPRHNNKDYGKVYFEQESERQKVSIHRYRRKRQRYFNKNVRRDYVACTANGEFYFGRLDLIGKGDHGKGLSRTTEILANPERAYKKQVAYFVPSYRKEWIAENPADEWIARNVNWATERQKELNAIAYLQPGE